MICDAPSRTGELRTIFPLGCTDEQETGLLMVEVPRRIEQNGVPTALLWHPLLGSDFEDRLVSAIEFAARETTAQDAFGSFLDRASLPGPSVYHALIFAMCDSVKTFISSEEPIPAEGLPNGAIYIARSSQWKEPTLNGWHGMLLALLTNVMCRLS